MNTSLEGIIGDRYQIVHKAGEGGMGELFLVRDLKLNGAMRALKILKAAGTELDQWIEQEAYILTRLQHRCLPNIYDFTTHRSRPYLVMDWIAGIHLGELLEEQAKPLSLSYIFYVANEVLEALTYLHSQLPPIIHRDLKPSNIMLAKDGTIKLIDFGISKQLGAASEHTALFGTRGYSSPEQLSGKLTDERTDIYSFGALLLRMLGLDPIKWLSGGRVERSLLRRLSAFPTGLKELIVDCLQEQPHNRPQKIEQIRLKMKQLQALYCHTDRKEAAANVSYAGKRIAIMSAHGGAGATLIGLSLGELYAESALSYAFIEHRLDEGELSYRFSGDQHHTDTSLLVDEQLECVCIRTGKYFMINQLEEAASEDERLQRTVELTTTLALQHDVIVDYSSHWSERAIDNITQHSDLIVLVNSPWTLKQSPRSLYRLNLLLQQAERKGVIVLWVHNRDQPFHGRASWKKLAGKLTAVSVPELSAKLVLHSLSLEQSYPPYRTITKQLKKCLMPLMKQFVRLQ